MMLAIIIMGTPAVLLLGGMIVFVLCAPDTGISMGPIPPSPEEFSAWLKTPYGKASFENWKARQPK